MNIEMYCVKNFEWEGRSQCMTMLVLRCAVKEQKALPLGMYAEALSAFRLAQNIDRTAHGNSSRFCLGLRQSHGQREY